MTNSELEKLADKINLILGLYYDYNGNDEYVDENGEPCPPENDYRNRYFRFYLDTDSGEMWDSEFSDSNSWNEYINKNIIEISKYEILDFLDRHSIKTMDYFFLKEFIFEYILK